MPCAVLNHSPTMFAVYDLGPFVPLPMNGMWVRRIVPQAIAETSNILIK